MEQYKYYVKGTVCGSKCYDSYTEKISSIELIEYLSEIKGLFTKDPADELAQYFWANSERDGKLYGVVTEIWVDVKVIQGNLYSWTEVTANRELTEDEKKALLDYLSGQFSDGYGEGLEQQAFTSITETEIYEDYDEVEEEYYTDEWDVNVYCYLHLWNHDDFHLEFVEADNTVEDDTPTNIKPKCKLIGEDGNIFNLIGIASRTLRRAGLGDKAKEMQNRVTSSGSYSEALAIIMEYVEVM